MSVTRVENEPLSVFNAEILEVAAVILAEKLPLSDFKLETRVENELDALVKELPVASFRVTRVEKDELAVVKELPVASFLVTRVENDPLSLVNELPVASFLVTRVEKLALDSVIEPLPSNKLTLLLKDELASVIEPLTPAAVNVLINEAFVPSEPLINEPIVEPNSTALKCANEPLEVELAVK